MVVATIIVDHSIWKKEPSTKKDIIFDSSNVSYSIIRNTNGGGWSSSSLQSVDDEKNVSHDIRFAFVSSSSSLSSKKDHYFLSVFGIKKNQSQEIYHVMNVSERNP
ncbi:hypothetical protein DERF_014814, partial [Dermatophagoides farinae]